MLMLAVYDFPFATPITTVQAEAISLKYLSRPRRTHGFHPVNMMQKMRMLEAEKVK